MPRAVRFDQYGHVDVLQLVQVDRPTPGSGQVLVKVKATGINPGEASIREGLLHSRFPATFPSGEGSDLAGIIEEIGAGVEGFSVGDEIIGFTDNRASHADFVIVEASNLTRRPSNVSWEVAGSLFVAGTTAYATVRAVGVSRGDTVAISGAAGGVGSLAVQLAVRAGARVLALASSAHHQWLTEHGAIPISYGEGVAERIREASAGRLDAFIDTYGSGYVKIALDLGVPPERIDTIIDMEAVSKYGVKLEGSAYAANAQVLSELAALIDKGELEIPIAKTYPLENVREAYQDLAQRHTLGKIVLIP